MTNPVWIIDDDRSIRWVLEKALGRENIPVKSFAMATEALRALADEQPPAALISDIRMPGISGVEAIRLIRLAEKEIPVIFITGFADDEIEKKAKELKPLAYLYKPFDCQLFLKVVEGAFN